MISDWRDRRVLEAIRSAIREELRAAGLKPAEPPEKPGLPVLFSCSCPREHCTTLQVLPIMVDGERCVDIVVMGRGGVVLNQAQRDQLADILNEKDWWGDHPDLRS